MQMLHAPFDVVKQRMVSASILVGLPDSLLARRMEMPQIVWPLRS